MTSLPDTAENLPKSSCLGLVENMNENGYDYSMNDKMDLAVGGQALIEGILMKSPNWVVIAVRKQDGSIKIKKEPFKSLTKKIKILGLPILRGVVMLIETMIIGTRALNFSANEALDEDIPEGNDGKMQKIFTSAAFILSIIISIFLAIFLFKFIPLYLTEQLRKVFPQIANSTILFNALDGTIRIIVFLSYIYIISCFKSFRRVFEFHGAEHKSIFAYEKGLELNVENARGMSPYHPRCGTSFIVFALVISIIILSFVPRHPVFYLNLLRRLTVIPLIMGVGYEVLKYTAKHMNNKLVRAMTYLGLLTQYITAKQPDDKQLEVALVALKTTLELEKI